MRGISLKDREKSKGSQSVRGISVKDRDKSVKNGKFGSLSPCKARQKYIEDK